jgi:hypothetical protein
MVHLTCNDGRQDRRLARLAATPPEDQPPLLVDADRVIPGQVATQLLEMIAGRYTQILIGCCVVDHLELAKEPVFEIGWDIPRSLILDEEGAQHASRKLTIMWQQEKMSRCTTL